MLVTRSNFDEVVSTLSKKCILSLDTETTGLRAFHGDRLFSIQIAASKDEAYYFNFYIYSGSTPDTVLPKSYLGAMQMKLFSDQTKIWFMHNAKFDLLMLEKEGMHFDGRVYCTMINARVLKNDSVTFSLKDLSKPLGFEKSDEVEKYIADHGLWEWVSLPGKKVRVKNKFFVKVPFDIMLRYGEQDAKVTHELGTRQLEGISKLSRKVQDSSKLLKPLTDIMELERKILSVTCDMQMQGIQLDKEYTLKAIDYEATRLSEAKKEFKKLTGSDFKQSSKFLSKIFEEQKDKWSYTEKGQPSFTDRALNRLTGPVVETIRSMRDATSKHQFYHSFLYEADQEGIVHPTLQQSGTVTGRFSATSPNLLAITKEEEEGEWKVRRAFVPRPGYRFVSMDFKQMEYILMLRYARESKLIEAVKAGLDLHEETGKLMGVDRKHAKTLNFSILYGSGAAHLSEGLGCSYDEAKEAKAKYFARLPKVQQFIRNVMGTAKSRGYIVNMFGRVYRFPDPETAYKAPNALIQGSGADILKTAMVRIHELLRGTKSRMILCIHDDIVCEVHDSEEYLIPKIQEIMESVIDTNPIGLKVDPSESKRSWGDLEKI